MAENMKSNEKSAEGMAQIAKYIDEMKFKNAIMGGVDKESVLISIQEIYRMFRNIYSQLEEEHKFSIQQLKQEQESNTALRQLTTEQEARLRENVERLRAKLEAEADEKAEEHIRSRLDNYERKLKLADENLQAANQRNEQEMTQLKTQHAAELEAVRRESAEKNGEIERSGAMLETTKSQLESQISTLQAQLAKAEAELAKKDSEFARELELAKAGSAAKNETLEEIYIEARQARNKALAGAKEEQDALLASANAKAEAIVKEATDEMSALREKADAEIADALEQNELAVLRTKQAVEELRQEAQANADSVISAANERAEQLDRAAEQRSEETDAHCKQLINEAVAKVDAANKKAIEIIAAAKDTYKQERAKYNDYLMKLGELRAKTVTDINSAVSKLTGLAFEISGNGVLTDSGNASGLSDVDEAVAEMEQEEAELSGGQEEEVHEQAEIIKG